MSGGAFEYVMGVMLYNDGRSCSGSNAIDNSGFNGPYCYSEGELSGLNELPSDIRYYDTYIYGITEEGYNRRILGDATGEMGPFQIRNYGSQQRQISSWHDDEAWFVFTDRSWFSRGDVFAVGSDTGVFGFYGVHGSVHTGGSFRIVLMI